MEYKNCRDLSNAELRLYQESLKNEYEVIKKEISDKFSILDEMDREYIKIENEITTRQNRKF